MKRVSVRFGILALLMLWAAAPAAAQVQRPRDTDNTRTADRALERGDDADDEAERQAQFQEALTAAQAEIAENPDNPLGYRLGARSALALGQYELAGEYFDKATELYPLYEVEDLPMREQTWIDLYQQAGALIDTGDYEGAAVIFENAHAIYKQRPEVMITLAQIYASIGELDKALDFIDQVNAFMDSDAASGVDEAMLAGWQEQAASLRELRAQVLAADNRLAEAADAYRELREANPENHDYTLRLAMTLMDMGNQTESLALYDELLSGSGTTGPEYYMAGVGFYQADDFEKAVRGFSSAADRNPRDRDALEMWARTLQLDSAWTEIPPVAQRWLELDPDSQSGWAILAQSANQAGDTETTQAAMTSLQALQVAVEQLELQRFGSGGGVVGGTVLNKTLDPGSSVTLEFTFYGENDSEMGTVSVPVTVGDVDAPVQFEAQLDSQDAIGGYSYELTGG